VQVDVIVLNKGCSNINAVQIMGLDT